MDTLVDSGVLIRLTLPGDPAYPEVRRAVRLLKSRGEKLIALTQNIAEFWNVCTRPAAVRGGYGLSVKDTARKLGLIENLVEIRPDSLAVFQEWKRLVVLHSVKGVQVHDARLVAGMTVYGIATLLTFNGADFKRYAGITIVRPLDVQ
jgi:predicted nucleic acid-binding protein